MISGCSTGIGEATAKLLAEKGWTVFAGIRKQTDAEKLQRSSPNIHPVFLDVTNPEQVKETIESVTKVVGENGLDALINNAGVCYSGPVEFFDIEDAKQQFDINFFGILRLTQAAMPLIRKGKPGRIINIGSIASEFICPYVALYDSTKSAVQTLTKIFKMEVAKWGVKVILVKPGPVKSNFKSAAIDIYDSYMKKYVPGTLAYEYYGKDLENIENAVEPFVKQMVDPSVTAKQIVHALTTPKPKSVYYDTWNAYFAVLLSQWLPEYIYDYLIGSIFFVKD